MTGARRDRALHCKCSSTADGSRTSRAALVRRRAGGRHDEIVPNRSGERRDLFTSRERADRRGVGLLRRAPRRRQGRAHGGRRAPLPIRLADRAPRAIRSDEGGSPAARRRRRAPRATPTRAISEPPASAAAVGLTAWSAAHARSKGWPEPPAAAQVSRQNADVGRRPRPPHVERVQSLSATCSPDRPTCRPGTCSRSRSRRRCPGSSPGRRSRSGSCTRTSSGGCSPSIRIRTGAHSVK